MAQKLLIHQKRNRHSRAKDILYLHDTIELLGGSLEVLGDEWTRLRQALPEGAIHTVEGALDTGVLTAIYAQGAHRLRFQTNLIRASCVALLGLHLLMYPG
jgi:hypothetical protein